VNEATAGVRPGRDLAPGYRVVQLLRRGEEVDVYDVWSAERECRCVAKVLRPDRLGDRAARRRLVGEGRLLASFAHPHLVRAYEVRIGRAPMVVLETLTGETLGHLVDRGERRLATVELGALGVQLCSALSYLHRNGVLHLDLKPSNVICQADQAKVIDLGIARPSGRGRPGVGTPAYMAPEQVRGGDLSTATDAWGLGALLYQSATRVAPFGEDGVGREPRRAAPVRTHRRLPGGVADIIDACLEPAPRDRPTVAQLATALREVAW
jgi:serine/threonine protein kinase